MSDPVFVSAWCAALLFYVSRADICSWFAGWIGWQLVLNRVGSLVLWCHILIAYWLAHQGSHAAAVEHVATKTFEMTGVASGIGVYANFVTATLWSWQVAMHSQRSGGRRTAIEIYLWGMFLSATVLFARPLSASFFLAIALLVLASRARKPTERD